MNRMIVCHRKLKEVLPRLAEIVKGDSTQWNSLRNPVESIQSLNNLFGLLSTTAVAENERILKKLYELFEAGASTLLIIVDANAGASAGNFQDACSVHSIICTAFPTLTLPAILKLDFDGFPARIENLLDHLNIVKDSVASISQLLIFFKDIFFTCRVANTFYRDEFTIVSTVLISALSILEKKANELETNEDTFSLAFVIAVDKPFKMSLNVLWLLFTIPELNLAYDVVFAACKLILTVLLTTLGSLRHVLEFYVGETCDPEKNETLQVIKEVQEASKHVLDAELTETDCDSMCTTVEPNSPSNSTSTPVDSEINDSQTSTLIDTRKEEDIFQVIEAVQDASKHVLDAELGENDCDSMCITVEPDSPSNSTSIPIGSEINDSKISTVIDNSKEEDIFQVKKSVQETSKHVLDAEQRETDCDSMCISIEPISPSDSASIPIGSAVNYSQTSTPIDTSKDLTNAKAGGPSVDYNQSSRFCENMFQVPLIPSAESDICSGPVPNASVIARDDTSQLNSSDNLDKSVETNKKLIPLVSLGPNRPQRSKKPQKSKKSQRSSTRQTPRKPQRPNTPYQWLASSIRPYIPQNLNSPQRFKTSHSQISQSFNFFRMINAGPNRFNTPQRLNCSQGLNCPQRFNYPQGLNYPQRFNLFQGYHTPQNLDFSQRVYGPQRFNTPQNLKSNACLNTNLNTNALNGKGNSENKGNSRKRKPTLGILCDYFVARCQPLPKVETPVHPDRSQSCRDQIPELLSEVIPSQESRSSASFSSPGGARIPVVIKRCPGSTQAVAINAASSSINFAGSSLNNTAKPMNSSVQLNPNSSQKCLSTVTPEVITLDADF